MSSGKSRSSNATRYQPSEHPALVDGRATNGRSKHPCEKNKQLTSATTKKPCPVKNKDET